MSDDNLFLILCYSVYWITFILLVLNKSNKKRVIIVNLVIQLIYTTFFLKDYNSTGLGGGVLVVWVFWMIVICIHWIVNLMQLIYIGFLKLKQRN